MSPVRRRESVGEQAGHAQPAGERSKRRSGDVDELDPGVRGRSQPRRNDLVAREQGTDLPIDSGVGREIAERDDENPGQRRHTTAGSGATSLATDERGTKASVTPPSQPEDPETMLEPLEPASVADIGSEPPGAAASFVRTAFGHGAIYVLGGVLSQGMG